MIVNYNIRILCVAIVLVEMDISIYFTVDYDLHIKYFNCFKFSFN